MMPEIMASGFGGQPAEYLKSVVRLMRERIETPADLAEKGGYFFRDPEAYDEQSRKKNWKPDSAKHLASVREALAVLEPVDHASVEGAVRSVAERAGVGASKLIHPLRLAVTGVSAGPGLFELMVVLGKDACVRRIDTAVARLG